MKTSKALPNNHLRAFTLIELLVVVSIIVVLSSLTIGVSGWVNRKSAIAKCRTQIELLNTKLGDYAADTGGYPQLVDTDGLVVYKMLFGDGVGPDGVIDTDDDTTPDGKPDPGATVYLAELDPNSNSLKMLLMKSGSKVPTKLVDPFGNPYRYRAGNNNSMNPTFDLWSMGPDGRTNNNPNHKNAQDDITNW